LTPDEQQVDVVDQLFRKVERVPGFSAIPRACLPTGWTEHPLGVNGCFRVKGKSDAPASANGRTKRPAPPP
jgi:hypothetical protein